VRTTKAYHKSNNTRWGCWESNQQRRWYTRE